MKKHLLRLVPNFKMPMSLLIFGFTWMFPLMAVLVLLTTSTPLHPNWIALYWWVGIGTALMYVVRLSDESMNRDQEKAIAYQNKINAMDDNELSQYYQQHGYSVNRAMKYYLIKRGDYK